MSRSSAIPSLEEAINFQASGRINEAENLLKRIVQSDPANAVALHALAIILCDRSKYAKAQEYAEEAIILSPNEALYYITLGRILTQQQLYRQAEESFRTSLFIKPLNYDAMLQLARICEMQEDIFGAIKGYQQLLEVHESGEVHYQVSKCLLQGGFVDDALKHLSRAHALLPFALPIILEYAHTLLIAGKLEKAEEMLNYAVQFYPYAPKVHHRLGILYHRMQDFESSLHAYECALTYSPTDKHLLMDYAVVLRTVGDDRSAEQVLAKIAQLSVG
jgi:tetratricopeptide (TPR) repeat protein